MKQAGRVSLVSLMGVVALVALVFVLLFSKEGLGSVGGRFMTALATHDAATLTKMTYMGDKPADEIRKDWDRALVLGKYYRFKWQILSAKQISNDSGAVRMWVWRNWDSPSTYEEKFELPLVKVGDEWKIDVRGIHREMFPGLPR